MKETLRDVVLETIETSLDAQLRAVRRLRQPPQPPAVKDVGQRMSQIDMAYDILKKAGHPLHITELLASIQSAFAVRVDRESLVSSLSKKIARGDRFLRSGKNTFGLR